MASSSKTTRDHDEIRRWAEERGGKPAHVGSTESKDDIGVLRLEFPGATGSNDASLEPISWEDFFAKFDERGLALLYQEETAGGEKSNFNKLVSGATADETKASGRAGTAGKRSGRATKTASKSSTKKKSAGVARKAAPAKKTAVTKKTAAKKSVVKKAAAKRPPAKKAVKKKAAPAKRPAASKTVKKAVKKGTASKATGRKAASKRR